MSQLPADVRAAMRQGDTIEAIRLLRQASGLGLKEAKDLVEAQLRGEAVVVPESVSEEAQSSTELKGALPPAVREALRQGDKIEAIRLLREHRPDFGLKEAKDEIEAWQVKRGGANVSGAEFGKVSGAGSAWGWLVFFAAAAALAYHFFGPGL